MNVALNIQRCNPETDSDPHWQEYVLSVEPGMVVLSALHEIHDHQDGTLAYRYACRGAICGSCAMRINGTARLACKTQIKEIADDGDTITVEPLLNEPVIKDLVVDQGPFFAEVRKAMPWLVEKGKREPDQPLDYGADMSKQELDQWERSAYCIKCQACFSGCPKRLEDPSFIGPEACVDIYKHTYDPREAKREERLARAGEKGGVFDCDKHGVCVKVCPKDIRPMRAITFLQRRIEKGKKQ
ncbi:MAG: 4Fe-4S dicluster domain-containing protein [Planctomycetes bacterium]|nr:4Fe-4S dicluster domain-containing protein [Planctomycetota bacterium]